MGWCRKSMNIYSNMRSKIGYLQLSRGGSGSESLGYSYSLGPRYSLLNGEPRSQKWSFPMAPGTSHGSATLSSGCAGFGTLVMWILTLANCGPKDMPTSKLKHIEVLLQLGGEFDVDTPKFMSVTICCN